MAVGGTKKDRLQKQRVQLVKKTHKLEAQVAISLGIGHLKWESPPYNNVYIYHLNTWTKTADAIFRKL